MLRVPRASTIDMCLLRVSRASTIAGLLTNPSIRHRLSNIWVVPDFVKEQNNVSVSREVRYVVIGFKGCVMALYD